MKAMKELKIDSVRLQVDYTDRVMNNRGLFNENENGGFVLIPDMHDPENYSDNDVRIFYL